MRPVVRGASPGNFSNYRDAADPLRKAIGAYCSYCERWIPTNLAIEHIRPKSIHPLRINEWDNFLFACANCNSCKGDEDVVLSEYYWPDTDNTQRVVSYAMGGIVIAAVGLPSTEAATAQKTIELVGLDKDPGNPIIIRRPTPNDLRWEHRFEVWECAQNAQKRLANNDTIELREQIAESAKLRGNFGIWYSVFFNDSDMRLRLINAFRGTAQNCFDTSGNLIQRPGGRI